jgi:hypothetical protein
MAREPQGTLSHVQQVAIRGRALHLAILTWTPEPDPVPPSCRIDP